MLSTTAIAPRSRDSAATAPMSTIWSRGFVGLSIHTMRVSLRQAAVTADGSVRSAGVNDRPPSSHTRRSSR